MRAELKSNLVMEKERALAPVPLIAPESSPFRFVVRYFAERKGNQWQAFSLELGLAVQADTEADVRRKMESMIVSYVLDAVTIDREHSHELLTRKATWQVYARYKLYLVISFIARFVGKPRDSAVYRAQLPLEPKPC
jgi:hypothetical protein